MHINVAQKKPPDNNYVQLGLLFDQDVQIAKSTTPPVKNVQSPKAQPSPTVFQAEDENALESIPLKCLDQRGLAYRMLECAMFDLGKTNHQEKQLFGSAVDSRKQDALIWIFDLNPDAAQLPFDWVCDELNHDSEMMRRVIARNLRADLKAVLQIVASMVGYEHGRACEFALSDYVDLTGWQNN